MHIYIRQINKVYPNKFHAVKNTSFEIESGEFLVLLGPSGCGKSTILRMIAGLEDITSGSLYFGDRLMNDVPPKDRNIGMVFQNYALYPHLSVRENIAFPLKMKKVKKNDIANRVKEITDMIGLSSNLESKPKELSGGQRQRVALGRAIAGSPEVYLFDEPLSNLDAKLRTKMRNDIISLHRRLGSTSVYVTHDQIEAMTMADRIVILKDGEIQQAGSPTEVYETPANLFVAGFIGSPQMNFFDGEIINDDSCIFKEKNDAFRLMLGQNYKPQTARLGIRPNDIDLIDESTQIGTFKAKIANVEYLGHESYIYLKLNNSYHTCQTRNFAKSEINQVRHFQIDTSKVHLFAASGERL